MRTALFAYSRRGCATGKAIGAALAGQELQAYTLEKYLEPGFLPLEKPAAPLYGREFAACDALIFVGSCGIAVRQIAPYVRDKKTDPAVVVVDELGKFVIALLSGHLGGANALAQRLAEALGAVPVITTATDVNGRFSVDAWAGRKGYKLSSMADAKAYSAAILERDLPLFCDLPLAGPLPAGTFLGESGDLGLHIGWRTAEPFGCTLRVIPPVLHLGLGCRRGTPAEAVRTAVQTVLQENAIDPKAIRCAASIDLKADEEGLLQFCREAQIPITFHTAAELAAVPGDFTPSAFVQKVTGVDNVCERSALLGADRLIVKKTACQGVTVAVAAEYLEVSF